MNDLARNLGEPTSMLMRMLTALGAAVLIGCAGPGRVPEDVRPDRSDLQPAAEPVLAEQLFALTPAGGAFESIVGQRPPLRVAYELARDPDAPGQWRLTLDGIRTTTLIEQDGGIYIVAEEEYGEDSRVVYDPALPLLPAVLDPDEPTTAQATMTVYSIRSGEQRDAGTCRTTIRLMGRQTVRTPAGEFDVTVVRTLREIELNMARVRVAIETDYATARGMVFEHIDQRILALGLFGSRVESSLRLIE